MSTRQQRRKANEAGRFYNVKSGVNSFFTNQVLLEQIQQAVQLVIPLLVEGNLLANLHVLRCIEAREAIPKLDQTFFNRCFYAVSFGTGHRAQQFNEATDPSLATSYNTLYSQSLPANHQKPACQQITRNQLCRKAHIFKRREFCTVATFLKCVKAI